MLGTFLIPETVVREGGNSNEVEVSGAQGKLVQITLGITRIVEQESLDVAIWGSVDKTNWGSRPLLAFPQKFYCGTYSMLLDLNEHRDVKFLRAQWKAARWGRGDSKPLFAFYVFVQESSLKAIPAGA
jgi:hypothetical protein